MVHHRKDHHALVPVACPPGEGRPRKLAEEICAYAEKVASPSFFLGPIDAFLFAVKHGYNLGIVFDKEEGMCVTSMVKYVSDLVDFDIEIEGREGHPEEVDQVSAKSWCIVSCNPFYDLGVHQVVHQHWVPAIFHKQMKEDELSKYRVSQQHIIRRQILDLQQQQVAVMLEKGGDFDCQQSRIKSLDDKLEELRNWSKFSQRCEAIGITPVYVPGDGNCLVWSLRCLFLGLEHGKNCTSPAALNEQQQMRHTLKHMWVDVQGDQGWQSLYNFFIFTPQLDENHGKGKSDENLAPQVPVTPPRKTAQPVIDTTPPDVAKKRKHVATAVEHVGDTKPVPFTARELPLSPGLRMPGTSKQPGFLEPRIPDFHEAFERVQAQPSGPGIEEGLSGSEAEGHKRRRAHHLRRYKTRHLSTHEIKAKALQAWLAKKGLDYHSFLTIHRDGVTIKKAAVCEHGGWPEFKQSLIDCTPLKCGRCLKALASYDITIEALQVLFSVEDWEQHVETVERKPKEQTDEGANVADDDGSHDEGSLVRQKCLDYIGQFSPTIEFIDGTPPKYRCTLCKTRAQPTGKVGSLVKMDLKTVMHFLSQHLTTDTHYANLRKLEAGSLPGITVSCPGYCVSDPRSAGALKNWAEEFRVYATHSSLSMSCKHSFWCDFSVDKWFVRSHDCEQTTVQPPPPGIPCCKKCEALGKHNDVLKRVSRFCAKYYAALLLRDRLFASEEELQATEEMFGKTHFAKHAKAWGDIVGFSNAELQMYVRKSFVHGSHEQTDNFKRFMATVVDPCLKIQSSAVHSNVASLSSQFLKALEANNQSVPSFVCGIFSNIFYRYLAIVFPGVSMCFEF